MSFEKFQLLKPNPTAVEKNDEAIITAVLGSSAVVTMVEAVRSIPKEIEVGEPRHKPITKPRPPVTPGHYSPSIAPDEAYPPKPPATIE